MIKTFVNQIINLKSIKKVFMNKRDIRIYDNSWNKISERCTEYDVEIITKMIEPREWREIVKIEKEFDKLFPEFRFNYHLIEFDTNITNQQSIINGKLIYDSDINIKIDKQQNF